MSDGAPPPAAREPASIATAPVTLGLRPALASAAYLALIAALAGSSGIALLLFPELAALTSVVIGSPAHVWARSPRLLMLTPCLTGAVGISLAHLLPYGPLSVGLVVALSLLLIRVLRSPVMPALSAGLLPLALGLHSWVYPLALLPGTAGLALLIVLRRRRESPLPLPASGRPMVESWPPLHRWAPPLVLFLAGALGLVGLLGSPLVLYPPLLVLAWETLARPERCPWRGRLIAVLVATAAAAWAGLLLVHWLGPTPLATFLTVLLIALLLDRLRLLCPPVFAVALLPFVVQAPSSAFPLHVLAGTSWLVAVTALTSALHRRRGD